MIQKFLKNSIITLLTFQMRIFNWADDASNRLNILTRMSSFSNRPSIQMIEYKYQNSFNFKFELVNPDQIIKFINETDCNKSLSGDIPAKTIKIAKEEIAEPITNCINSSISTCTFS